MSNQHPTFLTIASQMGLDMARALKKKLGIEGLEALESMMIAVESHSLALIPWVYEGIKNGPLGEGLPKTIGQHALLCGLHCAIKKNPRAVRTLFTLLPKEPQLLDGLRDHLLSYYGHTSLFKLFLTEVIIQKSTSMNAETMDSLLLKATPLFDDFLKHLPQKHQQIIINQELEVLRPDTDNKPDILFTKSQVCLTYLERKMELLELELVTHSGSKNPPRSSL